MKESRGLEGKEAGKGLEVGCAVGRGACIRFPAESRPDLQSPPSLATDLTDLMYETDLKDPNPDLTPEARSPKAA
jgi:hypothetical protein